MQGTGVIRHRPRHTIATVLTLGSLVSAVGLLADFIMLDSRPAVADRVVAFVQDHAEHAIYLGGIGLERNRHTIVGSTIGCVVGAAIGAGVTATAALVTGGAGLALLPAASALGCGVVGLGGAALGYPLDDYVNDLED